MLLVAGCNRIEKMLWSGFSIDQEKVIKVYGRILDIVIEDVNKSEQDTISQDINVAFEYYLNNKRNVVEKNARDSGFKDFSDFESKALHAIGSQKYLIAKNIAMCDKTLSFLRVKKSRMARVAPNKG
jgi:hypothetical protein